MTYFNARKLLESIVLEHAPLKKYDVKYDVDAGVGKKDLHYLADQAFEIFREYLGKKSKRKVVLKQPNVLIERFITPEGTEEAIYGVGVHKEYDNTEPTFKIYERTNLEEVIESYKEIHRGVLGLKNDS